MIHGKNILCFANDWHNDPTSKHQVMKLLSKNNRILWINSIGMRKPSVSSSDLQRIIGKLKSWMKGLEQIGENLLVFTPIVLPFPSSGLARRINTLLLRSSLWYYRKQLGMRNFQLWTFVPTMVELAGTMGEEKLIYYCVDEWSKFSFMDGAAMRDMEIRLILKSDVVFTTADHLYRDKRQFNENTYLIEHGVDHAHFSPALNAELPVPDDVKDVPRPILGFFGLIHEWIDLDLIEHVARMRPDWSIVMIGKSSVDISRFAKYRNVFFLGQKPYEVLPSYCRVFAAGLIPFAVNELTINVNPIKLREYLSAGLPVVSTQLPECEKYRDIVQIAGTYDDFAACVEQVLAADSREARQARSDRMAAETWDAKVERISDCIEGRAKK
ncbi:MAG TPA: glycosyltransferase [Dissulfurispiraceae bacterium]|nr:glycosyltransferase [Dissulfurispiraceae bacterium]